MFKATFAFSVLSCVSSVATLAVVLIGAKKVHDEIQDIRDKSNEQINKFKQAVVNFNI